jgi:hypothetical protein
VRAILERLLPYLVRVNHIHLDFKRDSGDILYASEVHNALQADTFRILRNIEWEMWL